MTDAPERLNVFDPVSKADWIAKVETDLRGDSPDVLRSRTSGGLLVEPLYVAEDLNGDGTGLPGLFPYVRGATPLGDWRICQEYDDPRPAACAELIRRDVESGVEALWIRLGPRSGCRVVTIDDFDALLASVDLGETPLFVEPGTDGLAVAAGLIAVAERRELGAAQLQGCFGLDPIGLLAQKGRIEGGLHARLDELCDLGTWSSQHAESMRAVCVASDPYHGGGANTAQEIAASIATGVEYVRLLMTAGLSVDAAARQILFAYPISSDFFGQVAKLRAARWLWAKVVVAFGGDPQAAAMRIHARTSRFSKTRRDPWVNMLRSTAECTAAILGGAQSIATLPFDAVIGPPDELAQRLARNTQLVLREESHLGVVADPAGGSWFVESATRDLAQQAWEVFQAIEAEGGVVSALGSGQLLDSVRDAADETRKRIAARREPVVGVSEFPNLQEDKVERAGVSSKEVKRVVRESLDTLDLGAHRSKLIEISRTVESKTNGPGDLTDVCVGATLSGTDMYSIATVLQHGQPDFYLEPVAQWREADNWERLRDRTDRNAEKAGGRTIAFLANLGQIPAHKARSTWTRNLLAAAGIEGSTNDGFADAEAVAEAYGASGAEMTVICGSDSDYETQLDSVVAALKAAGCPLVLVAGRPGDREAELREAGVSDFVFVGADVLAVMRQLLDALGVER